MPKYNIHRSNYLCFVLIVMIPLAGCSSRGSISGESPAGSFKFAGRVVYQDIEGGFYGIKDEDGHQYEPVNLPDDLKIDGLSVVVTAKLIPGTASTRMWGTVIRIVDIEQIPTPDKN